MGLDYDQLLRRSKRGGLGGDTGGSHKGLSSRDRETFDKLRLKNPLFGDGRTGEAASGPMEGPPLALNSIYQPYLYQQSGQSSRRKVNLSNRGIIASQEIKESEFRRRKKKLQKKKSKSRIKVESKKKGGGKSKRDFEGAGAGWLTRRLRAVDSGNHRVSERVQVQRHPQPKGPISVEKKEEREQAKKSRVEKRSSEENRRVY